MKLILVLGTSLSAAGLAAGFALIADQALSRESSIIDAPDRARLSPRIVPDLAVSPVPAHRTLPVEPAPQSPLLAAAATSAGSAAIRAGGSPSDSLVPFFAAPLAERPPRKPTLVADATPLAAFDMATPVEYRPVSAANFEYLPLIGVYR